MKFINLILVLLLVSSQSAWATSSKRDTKIAVKFDQSFYKLELTDGLFSFQEGAINYRAKTMPCNRAMISKMSDEYRSLSKAYTNLPTGKSEFDVQVTDREGKTLSVARGSKFGTWLRELPKTMMYFNAEVKTSCKR